MIGFIFFVVTAWVSCGIFGIANFVLGHKLETPGTGERIGFTSLEEPSALLMDRTTTNLL